MKAYEELEMRGIQRCPECHCATGDDTEYKDFSNKTIIVCAQCGYEWMFYSSMKPEEMKPVGYLINTRSGLQGERGDYFDYVMAENGVFVEAEGDLMAARIPISGIQIRGLAPLSRKVVLRYGSIPVSLLYRAVDEMMLDPATELYAAFTWDSGYDLRFPAQLGKKCKVDYAIPDGRIILDLHSHGSMKPHFSPQDTEDEKALRVYGVVGNLPGAPSLKLRVGVYGYFDSCGWEGIFDEAPIFVRRNKIFKFWR